MAHELLKIGPRITVAPVIHGSGDFAVEVRRMMLAESFDCVAVPLPRSFQANVEDAIQRLPEPSIVLQDSVKTYRTEWTPDQDEDDDDDELDRQISYVPIDPCQPVIAALRSAMGEHIHREFIDLETSHFEPYGAVLPDPYALKRVPIHRFAAALLPSIVRPVEEQRLKRIAAMGIRLRELAIEYRSILLVCSVLDWPWIREAYFDQSLQNPESDAPNECHSYSVAKNTLFFLMGELPFVTGLYERARAELESDENLSIDGIKELLLAARDSYMEEFKGRARKITPQVLSQMLRYIRNLTLIEHCFSPELTTIVTAAQQIAGDQYAMHVLDRAKEYFDFDTSTLPVVQMGIDRCTLPEGDVVDLSNRLPGPPVVWKTIHLKPRPEKDKTESWKQRWNPYAQCSWPPEDKMIEDFRAAVFDRARDVIGSELAKTEKFTTSVKDGIDIRDTVRHWYEGEIYVKVIPPNRGKLDSVVMLFDSPADPRTYPWRSTWYAEHDEESTLCFFATNFEDQPVGPGICMAQYGGAFFHFPPKPFPDIWRDRRIDFTETMEERLLAAACLHSECRQVVLLSQLPPGAGWRRLARSFGKTIVHLPLAQFSDSTIQQLRILHVLNGKQVRSYAADFIRKA